MGFWLDTRSGMTDNRYMSNRRKSYKPRKAARMMRAMSTTHSHKCETCMSCTLVARTVYLKGV